MAADCKMLFASLRWTVQLGLARVAPHEQQALGAGNAMLDISNEAFDCVFGCVSPVANVRFEFSFDGPLTNADLSAQFEGVWHWHGGCRRYRCQTATCAARSLLCQSTGISVNSL